jgi:hypothetical protein
VCSSDLKEAEPSADDLRRVRARLTTSLATENTAIAAVPFAFLKVGALVAAGALGLGAWQWAKSSANEVTTVPSPTPSIASCPPVSECPAPIVTEVPVPVPVECKAPKIVQCAPVAAVSGRVNDDEHSLRNLRYAVPADVADRWALEVGLLIDARVAVDEGRALDALGHVQRHAGLFPNSSFKEERLALEVLATCQAGRPELAKSPFLSLLELEPTSTYLPRIRSACGADFEKPANGTDDE